MLDNRLFLRFRLSVRDRNVFPVNRLGSVESVCLLGLLGERFVLQLRFVIQSFLVSQFFSRVVVVSYVLEGRLEVSLFAGLALFGRVSQEVAGSDHHNTVFVFEVFLFVYDFGFVVVG